MTTITDLQKRITELQADLDKMKEVKEWPQKGDRYWHVHDSGSPNYSLWDGDEIDLYRQAMGNVFRTEDTPATWFKVQIRAIELRGDWVDSANKANPDLAGACLSFNGDTGLIEVYLSHVYHHQGAFYMPVIAAETLLKEFTQDELKIWVTGGR